jgi:YihY family inner membrane protein
MFKRIEALQIRLEETVARWNRSLRRFSVLDVLFNTLDAFAQDQMALLAASLSYYALLALFPLLLVLISLASFFVSETAALEMLMRYVEGFFPGVQQEVQRILHQVIQLRGSATVFGILALLWSASGVFDVLQQALNRAWRAPVARAFWLQRVYSVAVVGILGTLFLISIAASAFSTDLVRSVLAAGPRAQTLWRDVSNLLSLGFSFIAYAFLYKLFPHVRVSWRAALLAAGAAALLWQMAKFAYVVYLDYFARFNLVYGSLGAIIGLLFWGYISAVILLFGAELSACLGRARTPLRMGA